jgi:hypothetical protein
MLRQILVHRQRAGEMPASRVRHTHHVEQCLKRAVLALAAMQSEKHDLGIPHGVDRGQRCRQRCPRHLHQRLERRRLCLHARFVQPLLIGLRQLTGRGVDGAHGVPTLAERRCNAQSRCDRYIALCRCPPHQHSDFPRRTRHRAIT